MRIRRRLPGRSLRRSNPPTVIGKSPAAAPPPTAPSLWRMRCMCGAIMEISAEDDGRRDRCEVCARPFDVRFTEDVTTGQKGVSLHYVADDRKSGETSAIGAGTTSFMLPSPSDPSAATQGLQAEPDLPDEAHFRCPCNALLAVPKSLYEKRSKCPACGARMLVFLLWDARAKTFTLQHFSLIDQSSGKTQVLSRL